MSRHQFTLISALCLILLVSCFGIPVNQAQNEIQFYRFTQLGEVVPAARIFNARSGTLSTWLRFNFAPSSDEILFHTDDDQFVFYLSSSDQGTRIAMRVGAEQDTPEVSVLRTTDGVLNTKAKAQFPDREWHLVAVTWNGRTAANGVVQLYLDGTLIGEQPYTAPLNALPSAVGIFTVPGTRNTVDQSLAPLPAAPQIIPSGAIDVADMRLYRQALSGADMARQAYDGVPALLIDGITDIDLEAYTASAPILAENNSQSASVSVSRSRDAVSMVCEGAPQSRLHVGVEASVAYALPGQRAIILRVRAEPGGQQIAALVEGMRVHIVGTGMCQGGMVWWPIETPDGTVKGWSAEGIHPDIYFLVPED